MPEPHLRTYPHMVRRVMVGETAFYQAAGNANRLTTKLEDTAWFPTGCGPAVSYAEVEGVMVRVHTKPVMRVLAELAQPLADCPRIFTRKPTNA